MFSPRSDPGASTSWGWLRKAPFRVGVLAVSLVTSHAPSISPPSLRPFRPAKPPLVAQFLPVSSWDANSPPEAKRTPLRSVKGFQYWSVCWGEVVLGVSRTLESQMVSCLEASVRAWSYGVPMGYAACCFGARRGWVSYTDLGRGAVGQGLGQ